MKVFIVRSSCINRLPEPIPEYVVATDMQDALIKFSAYCSKVEEDFVRIIGKKSNILIGGEE